MISTVQNSPVRRLVPVRRGRAAAKPEQIVPGGLNRHD
jgi:hypothetical protein